MSYYLDKTLICDIFLFHFSCWSLVIWSKSCCVKFIGLKNHGNKKRLKKENQLEFFFLLILILLYKYFRLYDYFLHRWYHGKRRSKSPLRCHIMLKCAFANQKWKFTNIEVRTLNIKCMLYVMAFFKTNGQSLHEMALLLSSLFVYYQFCFSRANFSISCPHPPSLK